MLKTLLTGTTLAAAVTLGAGPAAVLAQTAPEPATEQMAPAPAVPSTPAPEAMSPGSASAAGLSGFTRDELVGADIKTGPDNENVATVEDVLMNDDGSVKNIVARFGGFLGFGENTVLLMPDEVMAHRMDDGKVELTTTLTPDALKDRPEYKISN